MVFCFMNSVRLFKDYFTIFNCCILLHFVFFTFDCIMFKLCSFIVILIIKLIDEQGKTTNCTSVSKHALKRRPLEQNAST